MAQIWYELSPYVYECCIDAEGFFKVTGSHARCKSGNISETMKYADRQQE